MLIAIFSTSPLLQMTFERKRLKGTACEKQTLMKRLIFVILTVLSLGCQDNATQEEELEVLNNMFAEIEMLANSVACENAADWNFVAYGSKACGGPQGYIAYSNQIDVNAFLRLVENYTTAEREFNLRWGVASDCAFVTPPSEVLCENGVAVLNY